MDYFGSAGDFRREFFRDSDMSTLEPLDFTDGSIGFSIKKQYPDGSRYKPPITKEGKVDTVALIRVLYLSPDRHSEITRSHKVPLIIDISAHSKYLFKHYDYDFQNPDCPTQESIRNSKSTPAPINLEYTSEFYYDHLEKSIVADDGSKLTGQQVVDKVFNEHCNTTRLVIGLKYRLKVRSRNSGLRVVEALQKLTYFILKKGFGRSFEAPENALKGLAQKYDIQDMRFLSTNKIELLGYKAPMNVIVTYCLVVALVFTFLYFRGYKSDYIDAISSSPVLALCFSILALAVLDNVIPILLFRLVNRLIGTRASMMMKKIKF